MEDNVLKFYQDNINRSQETLGTYKIIIADDEEEVHKMTKMILKDFVFENKGLEFIDVYSGQEAKEALATHHDAALIFLDVVMETDQAGLEVVRYIREELKNLSIRIILRTGQPGEAPEEDIIRLYDINDYRLKTELTVKRLNTTLYTALRNYRDLKALEIHKKSLEKIIKASAHLFEHNSLNEFLDTILKELSGFCYASTDIMYIRENEKILENGLVLLEQTGDYKVIAGTGSFKTYVNTNLKEIPNLVGLKKWIGKPHDTDSLVHGVESGFVILSRGKSQLNNYIYIESHVKNLDFQLINLFLSNFSVALDNYILNNMLQSSQKEIVFTLAETVESHFEETGSHTKRITNMMYNFALILRYSYAEAEMIKLASSMHDLGKVGIPDEILKKPGKLTDLEFDVMKQHTIHGYNILKKPELPIIRMASEIALNHHEKWDGTGYPSKKKGLEIPKFARMMAIVDVYDAMTHNRVYKGKVSVEDALYYIEDQKGKHFDPELVNIFLNHFHEIVK